MSNTDGSAGSKAAAAAAIAQRIGRSSVASLASLNAMGPPGMHPPAGGAPFLHPAAVSTVPSGKEVALLVIFQ